MIPLVSPIVLGRAITGPAPIVFIASLPRCRLSAFGNLSVDLPELDSPHSGAEAQSPKSGAASWGSSSEADAPRPDRTSCRFSASCRHPEKAVPAEAVRPRQTGFSVSHGMRTHAEHLIVLSSGASADATTNGPGRWRAICRPKQEFARYAQWTGGVPRMPEDLNFGADLRPSCTTVPTCKM